MNVNDWVTIAREVDGLLIPTAVPVSIPAGTNVQIVQNLGGHTTINVNGNLVRIDKNDADALGQEITETEQTTKKFEEPVEAVDESLIWEQLKTCFDPEIPVNIVDLGLIYQVKSNQPEDKMGNIVDITMTLTAPGCNMGPVLIADVENKVMEIDVVTKVNVELVFEPPWDQSMMSEVARLELGMF